MTKFALGKTYSERSGMAPRTRWKLTARRETTTKAGCKVVWLRWERHRTHRTTSFSARVSVEHGSEVCKGGYYGFIVAKGGR